MLSAKDLILETASEAHWSDGCFDHDNMLNHLVFIAEIVSKDATKGDINNPDADELYGAIYNLEALVQTTAYIGLMRSKMWKLRSLNSDLLKEEKSC